MLQVIIKRFKSILNSIVSVMNVVMPFIIYFGIRNYRYRYLFSGLLVLYLLRLAIPSRKIIKTKQMLVFAAIGTFFGCFMIFNRFSLALYTPVLINLGLLSGFVSTLFIGPPVIETFARRHVKALSDAEVKYCRNLTVIWSLFFLLNGSISFTISFTGNLEYWIIYNGIISYILIGLMFLIEMTYRYYRFRNYGNTFIDSFYKKIFKPFSVE